MRITKIGSYHNIVEIEDIGKISVLSKATLSTARCIFDFWHIPVFGKNACVQIGA